MGFNKIIIGLVGIPVVLLASAEDYAQGIKYYQDEAYAKAFPIIVEEAKNDNKAASKYAFVSKKKTVDADNGFFNKLGSQFNNHDIFPDLVVM